MNEERRLAQLGFTKGAFPAGSHICQIFSDDEERNDALAAFLLAGFRGGEQATCFLSDKVEPIGLDVTLKQHDLDLKALEADGALALVPAREVYFKDGRFDPEQPLALFNRLYADSSKAGRAARVIGEMSPEAARIEGGHSMIEYEAHLNLFLQQNPMMIVCQYEASAFDGAVIMDVLRVHPMMVVRGEVFHNPIFLPPNRAPSN